jgi:hypothetical protein
LVEPEVHTVAELLAGHERVAPPAPSDGEDWGSVNPCRSLPVA